MCCARRPPCRRWGGWQSHAGARSPTTSCAGSSRRSPVYRCGCAAHCRPRFRRVRGGWRCRSRSRWRSATGRRCPTRRSCPTDSRNTARRAPRRGRQSARDTDSAAHCATAAQASNPAISTPLIGDTSCVGKLDGSAGVAVSEACPYAWSIIAHALKVWLTQWFPKRSPVNYPR
jgi:hypothetical protein